MRRWSPNLAYAIGLIASDGCLSKDERHIDLTSKDLDQIKAFKRILKLTNKIGLKFSGRSPVVSYYRIEFGDVELYRFLLSIGLTPNKSKTIGPLLIPEKYIRDFLRGSLDGDGYTYSYWDLRWKSSYMLYTGFCSASIDHINWLDETLQRLFNLKGRIKIKRGCYQLEFAKKSSIILLKKIYYKEDLICLKRKLSKINESLSIITQQYADVL